jgi:hypothetical protein
MSVIAISTCLPYELHAKIKKNYWKIPELIKLGVKAKEENPQIVLRIRQLEEKNDELFKTARILARKVYDFESMQQQTKLRG